MDNRWTESLKKNALIVNTYKRKVEHARAEKKEATMYDELEREDLEPILANALNMVKANVPAGMKAPKDTNELLIMFAESGLGDTFGIRDSEMNGMMGENVGQNPDGGGVTLEQLMAMNQQQQEPIAAPMPQGHNQQPSGYPKKARNPFLNKPMLGGLGQ